MTMESYHFSAVEQTEIDEFCKKYGSGSDVNLVDKEGYTLLHTAATRGKIAVIKFLIVQGADIQAKTADDDWTPLHAAVCGKGNIDVVKFLVSNGADVNAETRDGYTPLDVAKQSKHKAVAKYLKSVGGHRGIR